jgi:hypothetical protein
MDTGERILALTEENDKLRTAARYQAEAHELRTAVKLLADKLRSWGHQNKKQESNVQLINRVLDDYHGTLKYIGTHGQYDQKPDSDEAVWVPSRTALIATKALQEK